MKHTEADLAEGVTAVWEDKRAPLLSVVYFHADVALELHPILQDYSSHFMIIHVQMQGYVYIYKHYIHKYL